MQSDPHLHLQPLHLTARNNRVLFAQLCSLMQVNLPLIPGPIVIPAMAVEATSEPAEAIPPVPEPKVLPPAEHPEHRYRGRLLAILVVIALIVGFTVTYVAADAWKSKRAATPPTFAPRIPRTSPSPTPPSFRGPNTGPPASRAPSANDPNANVLQQLVVHDADVTNPLYTLVTGGDTTDDPTLDLCNGTYPSEALRTARLQINMYDAIGSPEFSTEAVLYRNGAATTQAFSELRSVAAHEERDLVPAGGPVG